MALSPKIVEEEGASAPETPETPENPRDSLAQAFGDRRRERIAEAEAESVSDGADDPDSEPAGDAATEEPAAEPAEPAGEEEPAAEPGEGEEAAAAAEEPAETLYKIKVNGADREYPLSKVLELASRAEGADEKFQRANELAAEARRLDEARAAPAEKPQPSGDKPDVGAPDETLVTSTALDEELATLGNDLQLGDPDQVKVALARVIEIAQGEGRAPSAPEQVVNAQEIVDQVTDRIDYDNALKTVGSEYSDVFGDSVSAKLASDFLGNFQRHRLAEHAGFEPAEVLAMDRRTLTRNYSRAARKGLVEPLENAMKGACDTVRNYRTGDKTEPLPKEKSAITVDAGDRITRKRATTSPPASKSGRPAPAAPPRRANRKDVVAGMRAKRGQLV